MKKRFFLILSIYSLSIVFAIGQSKLDTPFSDVNFNTGKWLLVFNEIQHNENWTNTRNEMTEKIRVIDNELILDSLKKEFVCDLKKCIDGTHEYVVTIYKDGKEIQQLVWDNTNNFSFGKLDKYFINATTQYYQTSSIEKLDKKIYKWKKKSLYLIYNKDEKIIENRYYIESYRKK